MKNVNSRNLVQALLLALMLVMSGALTASAQTGSLAGSGAANAAKQPTYLGAQDAVQKILTQLPELYVELEDLTPGTPAHKKKSAETLAYKQVASEIEQGKPVAQAHALAIQTLREGFNLENDDDLVEYRSISVALQELLTTP
jgi:hypothetical protein